MAKILKSIGIGLLLFVLAITLLWVVDRATNEGYVEIDFDTTNKIVYVDNEIYDFEILENVKGAEKLYMTVYYYDTDLRVYSLLNGNRMTKVYLFEGKYYVSVSDITNEELIIHEQG